MFGQEDIWLVALGGLAAFVANVLYAAGGTTGFRKYWRRFVASFILAASCNLIAVYLHTWAWPMLLMWPVLIGGMSLGYGGDTVGVKVLKRSIFALGVCTAGVFGLWATDFTGMGWLVLGLQVVVGAGSIALGVINPFKNAPVEQYLICQLLTLTIPFWGFI